MVINTFINRPGVVLVVFAFLLTPAPQSTPPAVPEATAPEGVQLGPTVHPALPTNASDLWLVPSENDRAARTLATYAPLVDGVRRYQAGQYAAAIALLTQRGLAATALADHAAYFTGLSQLRLGQINDARRTLDAVVDRKPQGYVGIAAAIASAEAAEASGDVRGAVRIYERIAGQKPAVTEDVLLRLGRTALASGDRAKAAGAYIRVYYEFPLTDAAVTAGAQLAGLQDQITHPGYKLDLGRAQILFGARRFEEARTAFVALKRVADGDDKELVDLRVGECDFNLKRWAAARDATEPYLSRGARTAEARFFYLTSLRELGARDQYVALTHALVAEFPDSSWSEEALNNLGSHYLLTSEDELAANSFRELYEKFPTGQRAERAAWKYGWSRYRNGDYREAVRVFETASVAFPRSDYRPSFLYWAARAHAKLGTATQAEARLRLVYTDYANSYYGRLAARQLAGRQAGAPATGDAVRLVSHEPAPAIEVKAIPAEPAIRLLLANGLYDDALGELRYAQRVSSSSSRIEATIAWTYHQQGELRRAITLMRRAYPQFLTAGGQQLPADMLEVIFPLTYWDSIRRESARQDLDPYVVAALIAQESTFDAGVRSSANAWGLMQIVPATGRTLARSLGIRRFTTATLTDPEINLKLGTLYFARLVQRLGGTHYALASYNAGESRVVRWRAERPGLDEDEFIDDIPFPETQNYVKRILGTAEDYRRLYGDAGGAPRPVPSLSSLGTPAASAVVKKTPATKAPAKKKVAPKMKKKKKKKKAPTKKKVPAEPTSRAHRR